MDRFDLSTCRWLDEGATRQLLLLSLLVSLVLTGIILITSGIA